LSAAFYGEMSVEKGRMVELNFHNYQILRLAEMPKIETVLVPTYDFWAEWASRPSAWWRRR